MPRNKIEGPNRDSFADIIEHVGDGLHIRRRSTDEPSAPRDRTRAHADDRPPQARTTEKRKKA